MEDVKDLIKAVARSDVPRARALLARGIDPNGRSEDGWCPLLIAAVAGPREMVEALLDAGADANARAPDRTTALMKATLWRRVDIARVLLARGANVSAVDNGGWTALRIAKASGDLELVKLLQRHQR